MAAALSTLQMFVSEYVADTIQKSDFDLRDFAKKKTAIYILLSDDKLTYHKLRKSFGATVIYTSKLWTIRRKIWKRRYTKYSRQLCMDIFKIKQY